MTPQPEKKVRILLLDDHALFREGLARLLDSEPDFDLLVPCATVDEALRVIESTRVDIVLLDFDLGTETGSRFLRRAMEQDFDGKVLVVTAGLSDIEAAEMLRNGVAGIFLKHSPPDLLSTAIRKVMQGDAWLDQQFMRVLAAGPPEQRVEKHPRKLSEREREVLRALLEGLTNKEIAARLLVSESSVKATLQHLFLKTNVRTRSQLVRIALEQYRDCL